ncbi:IS3 family transposase, partial [Escherichia coli]
EYITYWNQKRIKLSLGGLSPVEYRIEYQKAG